MVRLKQTPRTLPRTVALGLALLVTAALILPASAHPAPAAPRQDETPVEPDAPQQADLANATHRLLIPLIARNSTLATLPPVPLPQLQNGDFDGSGGWVEEVLPPSPNPSANRIIYAEGEVGVPPVASSPRLAWLGGTGSRETVSRLYQSVTLPSTYDVRLRFDFLIQSAETVCGNDFAEIIVNGIVVKNNFLLCRSGSAYAGVWREQGLSLRFFRGQAITVEFRTTLVGDLNSSFFVDNVELCGASALLPLKDQCPVAGWQEMGVSAARGPGVSNNAGRSAQPSFAVGADGRPWLAWDDNSGGNGEIYVRRWNGRVWTEAGSGAATGGGISKTGGESAAPALAVAPDGAPWVAWQDFHAGNYEIYVRRLNGGVWEEVGSGSAGGGGISQDASNSIDAALAFAPNGTPYVAWRSETLGGDSDIFVKRWNGTVWEEAGAGSASGGGISNNAGRSEAVSLAIAPNGTVYAAWSDESGGDSEIYVRRFTGSAWLPAGPGAASGEGISANSGSSTVPVIGVPADALPWVAWVDRSGDDSEIFVRRFNGSTWDEVGGASATGGGISNNAGGSFEAALAIGADGRAVVAWSDLSSGTAQIFVRRWSGSTWAQLSASASAGGVSASSRFTATPAVAITPDGIPAVAWNESLPGVNTEIYVRRYNAE